MNGQNILNDLYDWLNDDGIFSGLHAQYPTIIWHNDIDAVSLDLEYHGNRSGEKIIAPLVAKMLTEEEGLSDDNKLKLTKLLYQRFHLKWEKLYSTLSLQYNPISNYDMTEHRQDAKSAEQTSTTGTNAKTYGFNSAEAVNKDSADSSYSAEGSESNEYTLTRTGNIGVTTSQQMLTAEREVWLWQFFDEVYKDIDSVMVTQLFGEGSEGVYYPYRYNLPTASATVLGGVKIGAGITITDGVISADAGYELPAATSDTLGGVKIKDGLTVHTDGALYADVQSVNGDTGEVVITAETLNAVTFSDYADGTHAGIVHPVPATETMTQSVGVGDDGMLYTEAGGGGGGGISYSTEEQDTGLTWIDGSPVYQKSYFIEDLGTAVYTTIDNTVPNIRIIDYGGSIDTNGNIVYQIPYYDGSSSRVFVWYQNNNLMILHGSTFRYRLRLTIKYIKL